MTRRNLPSRIRGVAAVEMAILLVPLVLLTFGMTEMGRAVYYYNSLLKSTRDAARYLSMVSPEEGAPAARCLAVYGRTTCTDADTPLVPGLNRSMVATVYTHAVPSKLGEDAYGSVDVVTVSITGFPYHPLVPLPLDDFIFGTISTTMRQAVT